MYLFISGPEIFIVLLIAVMLFGADKLPEIAQNLGKGMRTLKNATNEIKKEIQKSAEKNNIDIDLTSDIKKEIHKVKEDFEDITGPVKRTKL